MGFYRTKSGIAGIPGVALYNVQKEDYTKCCCGLIVDSVEFELIDALSDPFCLRKPTGEQIVFCSKYENSIAGATLLAVDYLDQIRYVAFGNTKPERPCGFCENSVYIYYLYDAEEVDGKYIIRFEVEDCSNAGPSGIEPRDYICTVRVRSCPK